MKYDFKTVRKVLLREYIIELNKIKIDTSQNNEKKFEDSLKKSSIKHQLDALIRIITMLEDNSLIQKDFKYILIKLQNDKKERIKKTNKFFISYLEKILSCDLKYKLFKSFNKSAKNKYLLNTLEELESNINLLLDEDEIKFLSISKIEYDKALEKMKIRDVILSLKNNIDSPIYIENSFNINDTTNKKNVIKKEFIPLYDSDSKSCLEFDIINGTIEKNVDDTNLDKKNDNFNNKVDKVKEKEEVKFLLNFYQALFDSFKLILLSTIFQDKRGVFYNNMSHYHQFNKRIGNLNFDIEDLLAIKQIDKSKSVFYIVNISHYFNISVKESYYFCTTYLKKGSSSQINNSLPFYNVKNTFYDINIVLFPNNLLLMNYRPIYDNDVNNLCKNYQRTLMKIIKKEYILRNENDNFQEFEEFAFKKEETLKYITDYVINILFTIIEDRLKSNDYDYIILEKKIQRFQDKFYRKYENEILLEFEDLDTKQQYKKILNNILFGVKNKTLKVLILLNKNKLKQNKINNFYLMMNVDEVEDLLNEQI